MLAGKQFHALRQDLNGLSPVPAFENRGSSALLRRCQLEGAVSQYQGILLSYDKLQRIRNPQIPESLATPILLGGRWESGTRFVLLALDPLPVFLYKFLDHRLRGAQGGTDDYGTVRLDDQGQGFAPAANNLIYGIGHLLFTKKTVIPPNPGSYATRQPV